MKKIYFILLLATSIVNAQKVDSTIINLLKQRGSFAIFNKNFNTFIRVWGIYNSQQLLPASTFKIPNALIGLESDVIKDENFVIKWDGKKRGNKDWNKDHTLASAIKYSVVPYFQELARRVGREKMQKYLNDFNYGNKTIGERVDTFWLDNSLKISPREQVLFLKDFYEYRLPISKRSIDIVKKILSEEKYPNGILKFKTGTGKMENGKYLSWLVGYFERADNTYYFAFNISADTMAEVQKLRDELPRKIMKQLGIIEEKK